MARASCRARSGLSMSCILRCYDVAREHSTHPGSSHTVGGSPMRAWIVMGLGGVLVAGAAPFAFAHDNGHESRTVAQCERLPGTAATGERAHCLRCMER